MTMPIISLENISKGYKSKKVLDALDWHIPPGDVVALLGRNGAGKSTLLETIVDLREAESGQVQLWGRSLDQLSTEQREKIAFVPQECKGFEWMKVKHLMQYLGGFFSGWDNDYCHTLLSRWQIGLEQRVGDLSGGQYQMLFVIHALAIRPEIIILDEPVAHLDPRKRREFIGELVELCCENHATAIFSSHIVSDLERVASKVALLRDGKISHYHDLENLKSHVAKIRLSADFDLRDLPELKTIRSLSFHGNGATGVITEPLAFSLEQVCQKHSILLERMPISLEDWYLEVDRDLA